MAHFSIISSQGQHPTLFTGAPKYVGAYLKPGYLEFPAIGSPTAISWHVGDYVVYSRTGKTYRLYRTPQAVEQGRENKYGGSFLYENVQFYDDSKQLELCPFTDLVPDWEENVHFSTQNTVSFFGKPSNVAERIQACLENQYGAGSWAVKIVTTTDPDLLAILDTEIEFAVSGVNCLEALDKVYNEWSGLGWIHTVENGVNTITIGASNVRTNANTTAQFAFGNGLVRVERSIANGDKIGTRLFAYGSMKNMDATYYRGLDIYDAEAVDIEHLMIPLSSWGTTGGKPDARKAFIQNAAAIASLGLIPRTAYFDGTGDLPDIHPTIERMTIGEVYDAGGAGYVPDLSKWDRDQRIDEIVSATNPIDHGTASEQGQKYAETVQGELVEDANTHFEGEPIDTYIGTFTTTKDGKLILKFGQNAQAIVLSSITGGIDFSDLVLEVLGSGVSKTIPIETPVYSGSNNTFTFHLPESVVIPGAEACEVSLYLNGVILTATSGHDYTQKTFTIGIDTSTPVEAKVEYEIAKTFVIRIPQIGFDIDDYADLGNGKTISMKTGMCAGRDFEVKDASYVPSADAWDLTLYRAIDEDLNIMFPNADYEIAAADQYVLLDIAMPEMYVTVASSRLLAAAQKLLADISVEKPFYAPQIDAKVVYNESRTLREGMWMDITQEGNREYVLIDSITIDENGSNIPTYEVALRQDKGIEWTENIGKSSGAKSSVSAKEGESASGSGTVKSVGLIVPTGMEVEGSPVTNSGTMRIVMADGYKIPREDELAQYFEPDSGHTNGVKLKSDYASLALPDLYLGTPAESLVADLGIIGKSLGSLQAQLDSVASRDCFDELMATTAFIDTLAADRVYANRYYFTNDIYFYIDVVNGTPCVHLNADFITDGDQILGDGTPGGGGGGGVTYFSELQDVSAAIAEMTSQQLANKMLIWDTAATPVGGSSATGAWSVIDKSSVGITTDATQNIHGLMSAADKTKLDGINTTYIANGETAYEALNVIGPALQSLQAQLDSVASRDCFDELTATAAFVDMLSAGMAVMEDLELGGYSLKSIPNDYIANPSITINGTATALGGSFATANITAGTAGTSSATSGASFAIPYVTMNKYGVVTGYGTHTHTISQANLFGSSAIGSAALPVYYNGSALASCDGSSIFSALSSGAATNISATIAGQTRTATLYATYDSASENISDKFGIVGSALQSLQAQVDAVASRVDISDYEATTEAKMDYMCDLMRSLQAQIDSVSTRIDDGGYGYFDMLAVGGDIYCDYLFTTSDQVLSDERKKNITREIVLSAEQIASCRAVAFDWTDRPGGSFGTIAQDWEKILPESVDQRGDTLYLAYKSSTMVGLINLAREVVRLRKEVKQLRRN